MASLTGMQRKAIILSMLGRLKQICDHPALYLKESGTDVKLLKRSLKMDKLAELLKAIHEQGESCLIFTQYIEMGNMIKQLAEKMFGEPVQFLNGSLSKQERDKMVDRFQKKEFNILILSLKQQEGQDSTSPPQTMSFTTIDGGILLWKTKRQTELIGLDKNDLFTSIR